MATPRCCEGHRERAGKKHRKPQTDQIVDSGPQKLLKVTPQQITPAHSRIVTRFAQKFTSWHRSAALPSRQLVMVAFVE
jgi:hypothetical protein